MHPAQQRYWLRIAAGALTIFGVGMGTIYVTRHAIPPLKSLAALKAIPLAMLPVRVDGQELGRLHQVDLTRDGVDSALAVHVVVRASDSARADRFQGCLLVPRGSLHHHRFSDFRCLSPADSSGTDLRKLGEIAVEPDGPILALMVPAKQFAEWQSNVADDSDVQAVRIQADSHGAFIDVSGPHGRKLVHLEADSTGARISVSKDSAPRPAKRR